jgi:hypothetical protein
MKTKLLALGALFASLCASVQGQPTPLLHLSFDNVSGTTVTNDGSGGPGMDGTLNGGATSVGGGMFGNALQVTGVNSPDASVRVPSAVVPLNVTDGNAWTLACWIKTTTQGGTWMYQGDGGWAANNTTFFMALNNGSAGNNSHAAGGVRFGQGWQQGTTAVDNGQWHHIVFTFDGTNKVEYVDGVRETWVANGWAVSAADSGVGGQFWIGGAGTGQGDGQVCLNGLIDEAYVFDVALSASDVNRLFANNSLTIAPVPVAVTVTPDRGLRGTFVTITATATPAAGTVTNATANLSAFGLTNKLQLVQSSPNVFTNSFTVPNNNTAPIGLQNVIVTVKDTEPLVGSGATNFYVLAIPPTNATIVTQLTSKTNYQFTEVSFFFAATNDAPNSTNNAFFPMAYFWYTNSVLVSTNPFGPWFTFLTTPDQNNLSIQCIARVNDDTNYYSSLSVTSAPVTLTVIAGSVTYTNGLKQEIFSGGATRRNVEIGNVGPGVIGLATTADDGSAGGFFGNNTSRRYSGYFIPPTTDNYIFFLASDDDSDLFLSTNSVPGNKQLIAQETVWSNPDQWQTSQGNSSLGQKRSDTFSPDGGLTVPYTAGIPLVAGQLYYIESVIHNGVGGDGWAVTYETMTEFIADPSQPVDGSASRLTAASNNIAVITWPGTTLTWAKNLSPASATVTEGDTISLSVLASGNAEMAPAYQWYVNDAPFIGATGTNFILANIPLAYNNATIYAVSRIPEGSLVITSSVTTLHVGAAVHEAGFVHDERWDNKVVNDILTGNVSLAPNFQMAITEWGVSTDNAGGHNDFARRVTGYFKPPTTGLYTFYVTSDDDSILFVSTDDTPGHKRQVASQGGWNSGGYRWNTANGGGVASQTVSDTFTIGGVAQNPGGIMLTNGQRYYVEQDMHQGGGGANLGVTFTAFGAGAPAAGTQSALNGNAVEMTVPRCTYVAYTQQPQNVANARLGSKVAFTAAGATDSQVSVGGPIGYEETFANSKLFFKWFTNGVQVPGQTSSKLLLGPVTADMVGITVMCQARALGYTDDSLNPIWTNSTSATILSTVAAPGPSLRGHWLSGAASLADTANVDGPGVHDAFTNRVTTSTRFLRFTNDVPPGATAGAQSLFFNNNGLVITNTAINEPGYVTDTFDGGLQNGVTVMCWAKGFPGAWNPWVSKFGENGVGWQLRINNTGPNSCWTMRGTGGNDDMTSSVGSNDGKWHHYAGTWDGTTFIRNLYVDGVLTATTTGSTPYVLGTTSDLMIGARDAGNATFGNFFTGTIYDVRIYNYPVTQSENLTINNLPLPFTSQVVAGQLVLTFPVGTLLEATNLLGPWTTNSAVSPATIDMTGPQKFFLLKNP